MRKTPILNTTFWPVTLEWGNFEELATGRELFPGLIVDHHVTVRAAYSHIE